MCTKRKRDKKRFIQKQFMWNEFKKKITEKSCIIRLFCICIITSFYSFFFFNEKSLNFWLLIHIGRFSYCVWILSKETDCITFLLVHSFRSMCVHRYIVHKSIQYVAFIAFLQPFFFFALIVANATVIFLFFSFVFLIPYKYLCITIYDLSYENEWDRSDGK